MAKPNCYDCKHRGGLGGSAHSKCIHPSIGETDPLEEIMGIFASVGRVPPIKKDVPSLDVKGNAHGISKGWFNWPYNFDPTWLESCNGFEAKVELGE